MKMFISKKKSQPEKTEKPAPVMQPVRPEKGIPVVNVFPGLKLG